MFSKEKMNRIIELTKEIGNLSGELKCVIKQRDVCKEHNRVLTKKLAKLESYTYGRDINTPEGLAKFKEDILKREQRLLEREIQSDYNIKTLETSIENKYMDKYNKLMLELLKGEKK